VADIAGVRRAQMERERCEEERLASLREGAEAQRARDAGLRRRWAERRPTSTAIPAAGSTEGEQQPRTNRAEAMTEPSATMRCATCHGFLDPVRASVGRHLLCQSGARNGGSWSRPDNRKIELPPSPSPGTAWREQATVAPPRPTYGLADPIRGAHQGSRSTAPAGARRAHPPRPTSSTGYPRRTS